MLVSAFFIGKLVNESNQISVAEPVFVQQQQQQLDQLQMLLERGVPPHRAIRRSSSRKFPLSTLVDINDKEILVSFPEPLLRESRARYRKRMLELSESSEVLVIRTPPLEFVGPFQLEGDFAQYALFKARVLRREEQVARHFLPVLLLMLCVGTMLCAALAWRLTTPLKELKQATRRISLGELETKIKGYETRRDEIGQLAQDFNQMSSKLAQSIEQQQRLMANISHELRTPLTRLHLASAMLSENPNQGKTKLNVKRIEDEITIMDGLIGQAIDLARMSLGQLSNANKPSFSTYSLADQIKKLEQSLLLEAESLSKTLTITKIPDVEIALHAQTFDSCIENIARNALRFADGHIKIAFEVLDDQLHIYVSDDGIGADENAFEQFLKPFNYAREPQQEHQSYGLGLAIAEAGIKMHGGTLSWAPSRLGGLTVLIRIPLHER